MAPFPDLNFTKYRTCPKCGRKFMASPMADFAASLKMSLLPAWARPGAQSVPTLPRIESAQIETGKLEHKVDELQARLELVQKELPAPNELVAGVREELGNLETRLGEMGKNLDEARQEFLGLIPDATDLAYLKLAKADVAELRAIVMRLLEQADREQRIGQVKVADRRAWFAIGLAGVSALAAVVGIFVGR